MKSFPLHRGVLGAVLCGLGGVAAAQGGDTLSEVTVTGASSSGAAAPPPAQRLVGNELLLRAQGNLGDTLDGLPGVSATQFGPAASRPVLRGLDGDRVRILNNGTSVLDVSGLSADHAVPVNPLSADAVEVLRGPAALRYGASALGGVVNLVDTRIPREPVEGLTGRADLGVATGQRETRGALMLEGGQDRYALHVDAFQRDAGQVRVPVSLPCTQGGVTRTASVLCNSQSADQGAALGGTRFFDQGYLGASVSAYRSHYGSPAEDEATLRMASDRYALDGLWRLASGPLADLRLQAQHTRYRHTEFEAGVPGTVFRNQGNELRLEARHRPLGPASGVVGLQAGSARFQADGQEAFAPYTRTGQWAAFVHETVATAWGQWSLAGRQESVRVESFGHPTVTRLAAGQRDFAPTSLALGAQWKLSPAWQLSADLSHAERAPRDSELFANGPHVATGTWEVGSAALGLERSNGVELGAQWRQGEHRARVAAFVNEFSNYIALAATGARHADANGNQLPEFAYRGVPARLQGLEAQGSTRLWERPSTLDLQWRGDWLHGTDRSTGQPLPRLAPLRGGVTLVWERKPWGARLGVDHAMRQARVPSGDVPVSGYTLWHAGLTRRDQAGGTQLLWYARLDNLTDARAYSATSLLTQSAPGRVPLPGRSLRVGVRADF